MSALLARFGVENTWTLSDGRFSIIAGDLLERQVDLLNLPIDVCDVNLPRRNIASSRRPPKYSLSLQPTNHVFGKTGFPIR